MNVDDDPRRGLGAIGGAAEFLAQYVLHAEIERKRNALAPGHGELGIVVDEFLDAGETLAVHVDEADHVTCGGPIG